MRAEDFLSEALRYGRLLAEGDDLVLKAFLLYGKVAG